MLDHIRLVSYGRSAGNDCPKREGLRVEDVARKLSDFYLAQFEHQGNELLQRRHRADGDVVFRIHLQSELNAVRVFDYAEYRAVLLIRFLSNQRRGNVVQFARYGFGSVFACKRSFGEYDYILCH